MHSEPPSVRSGRQGLLLRTRSGLFRAAPGAVLPSGHRPPLRGQARKGTFIAMSAAETSCPSGSGVCVILPHDRRAVNRAVVAARFGSLSRPLSERHVVCASTSPGTARGGGSCRSCQGWWRTQHRQPPARPPRSSPMSRTDRQ